LFRWTDLDVDVDGNMDVDAAKKVAVNADADIIRTFALIASLCQFILNQGQAKVGEVGSA
jgi:hypothetical protein